MKARRNQERDVARRDRSLTVPQRWQSLCLNTLGAMLLNLIDQVKRGFLEHSLYSRRSVGLLWGENCAPSSWHKASGSRHRVLLRQADLTHESLKAGIGAKRIEIGVVLAKMSICNRQTVMRRCRHRGKPEGQRTASSRTHLSPYRWYVRRKGTAGRADSCKG